MAEEETFSADTVKTVEALVRKVDAIRAAKLDPIETAEKIAEVEAQIAVARGGRKAHNKGVGVVKPLGD